MARVAAVVGLASEAAILRRAAGAHGVALTVRATGGRSAELSPALDALLASAPDVLVSFGLAGALSGALAPGDALCPEAVIAPGGDRLAVDRAWQTAVADAAGGHLVSGDIAGVDSPVTQPAAKVALASRTGAAGVDMESHAVAARAAGAAIPMLVLRAVADGAGRAVPTVALHLLDADGRIRWRALPRAVPHIRTLLALKRESARAHASLHPLADALMRAAAAR